MQMQKNPKLIFLMDNVSDQEIKIFFEHLNSLKFHDIIVIANNGSETKLLSPNAFENKSLIKRSSLASISELFNDKIINLHQSLLLIRVNHEPPYVFISDNGTVSGVVNKFLDFFCAKVNATCRVNHPKIDSVFLIGLNFYSDQNLYTESSVFSFTYPIGFNHYCILVPKSKMLSRLWAMKNAFEDSLIQCVLIIIILCVILWYYIVKGTPHQKSLLEILFLIYGMLITNSISKLLKYTNERIFCLSFIIMSFYLLFAYNCKLTALLLVPEFEKDIDSFTEAEHHNISIIFPQGLRNALYHNDSRYIFDHSIIESIEYEQSFPKKDNFGIYLPFSDDKKLGQLVNCETAKIFVSSQGNLRNGEIQYRIMQEQLVITLKSWYLTFRHPILNQMNILNAQLIESGIWQLWENGKTSYSYNSSARNEENLENSNDKRLLESQIIFEFWKILLVGYVTAVIALMGEILVSRYKSI